MPDPNRKSEFFGGAGAVLPILLGVFPFGMIYGVLAKQAGLPDAPAQLMSSILFAGSSQFIAAQLFGTGTPGAVIVLTAFVVNLRHALYSASLEPYVKHLSKPWKMILAYLLTDEAYAVAVMNYNKKGVERFGHWYFLGAGLGLWTCWQISCGVGIFLGAQIPASWSLDFTLALTFIALVVPALKDKPAVAAALSAGLVALLANGLPYKLGLIAAALAGIAVGLWSETSWQKSGSPSQSPES
jgi:4-azaleucine resistance transporter AzlC